mgnify:CR=1 FL=1
MIMKDDALQSLIGGVGWNVKGDTVIYYADALREPTSAEIDAEVTRLQAEYDSQEYARKRKAEYDQLNQFELISDDSINGTTTHKDAILAIKDKYPKE